MGGDVMKIGMRHIDPMTSCPECGYDMRGFDKGHACPECGVAFDPSVDLRQPRWYLRLSVACIGLAIVLLPFLALVSLLLVIPTLWVQTRMAKAPLAARTPVWCRGLIWRVVVLRWVLAGEFAVLHVVSLVWPDALNWW